MKRQLLSGLALLFVLLMTHQSFAQSVQVNEPDLNRPHLFSALPAELPVTITDLDGLLLPATAAGRNEDLMKGEKKVSSLVVNYVSATSKYENQVHSVVLRLKDYPGAALTLSSSTNPDGTVAYVGRIISFKHADMYELVKKGESYFWKKRNFYDVVAE